MQDSARVSRAGSGVLASADFSEDKRLQQLGRTEKIVFGETPKPARETRALPNPSRRFRQICLVNFKPNEFFYAAISCRDRAVSDAQKGVKQGLHARRAVQLDAPFRKLNWKGRGMRPFFLAALNRLIRNEPCVAATTAVAPTRV